MEVVALAAEIDMSNINELFSGNRLKVEELNSLFYDLLRCFFAQVSASVPHHTTSFQPLRPHRFECIVVKALQVCAEGLDFRHVGDNVSV